VDEPELVVSPKEDAEEGDQSEKEVTEIKEGSSRTEFY